MLNFHRFLDVSGVTATVHASAHSDYDVFSDLPIASWLDACFALAGPTVRPVRVVKVPGKKDRVIPPIKDGTYTNKCREFFKIEGVTMASMGTSNRKLGGPGTYRPMETTCPRQCPYWKSCYAFHGPTWFVGRDASDQTASCISAVVSAAALAITKGQMVRLHVTGDFMAGSGALDEGYIRQLVRVGESLRAAGHTRPWAYTYTHAHTDPAIGLEGAIALRDRLKSAGVRVLLSDVPMAGGALVWSHSDLANVPVPDGVRAIACPAQTHDRTCATCKYLCHRAADIGVAIVFDPHGTGARKVGKASKTLLTDSCAAASVPASA